jgi:hypothetical protein
VTGEENVVWLQVPVHPALLVQVADGHTDLDEPLHDLVLAKHSTCTTVPQIAAHVSPHAAHGSGCVCSHAHRTLPLRRCSLIAADKSPDSQYVMTMYLVKSRACAGDTGHDATHSAGRRSDSGCLPEEPHNAEMWHTTCDVQTSAVC